MSAKKMGCLRNFLAVAFTTVVTPVLANVIAQDVKDWQDAFTQVLTGKPEGKTEWNRPTVEVAGRAPLAAPAVVAVPEPPARKAGAWHWAAGAWGQ